MNCNSGNHRDPCVYVVTKDRKLAFFTGRPDVAWPWTKSHVTCLQSITHGQVEMEVIARLDGSRIHF